MYKLLLMVFAIGGFIFAGSLNEAIHVDENSKPIKNQYSWANDSSDDDSKIEAGRRRGKQSKADRRRGGGGLR